MVARGLYLFRLLWSVWSMCPCRQLTVKCWSILATHCCAVVFCRSFLAPFAPPSKKQIMEREPNHLAFQLKRKEMQLSVNEHGWWWTSGVPLQRWKLQWSDFSCCFLKKQKVEWHVADHEGRKYVPVSWNRGLKRTVPSVLSFIRAVHTMTPSLSRLLSASGQRDTPAQSETRLVLFLGESKAPFFQRIKTPV